MQYKVGDLVIYVSPCFDGEHNHKLKLNDIYTVIRVDKESLYLDEPSWWVEKKHLELFTGNLHDKNKVLVCRKVVQLNTKFTNRHKGLDNDLSF